MYHVMFSNDDVRQMTLDQVDDCFRLGVINEETLLWTEGMVAWETLREAAGLGEPTRNAPAPPRRGNPPPHRRTGRAEPPPRKRTSTARAVSSPEVVTSARPLQTSRPAVAQLPPLQPAPLPGQGYQSSRHPSHASTPAPSYPAPSYPAPSYPAPSYPAPARQAPVQQALPSQAASVAYPEQLYQQQALSQTSPGAYPTTNGHPSAPTAAWGVHPAPAVVAPQAAYASATNAQRSHVAYAPGATVGHATVGHGSQWGQPSVNPFVQQSMQSAGYWSSPVASAPPSPVRQNHVSTNVPATNSLVPVAASKSPPAFDLSGLDDVPFGKGRGAGFARLQRWVFVLSVFAGGAVVAYRNDYLLQLARSARLERTYLALESKYLGGAPEGTLRALKGVGAVAAGAAANAVWDSSTEIVSPASHRESPNVVLTPPPSHGALEANADQVRGSEGDAPKPSEAPIDKPSEAAAQDNADKDTAAEGAAAEEAAAEEAAAKAAAAKSASASSLEGTSGSGRAVKSSNVGSAYSGVPRAAAPGYSSPLPAKTTATPSKAFQESLAKYQASKRNKQSEDSSSSYSAPRNEPAPKPGTDDFLHMNMRQAITKKSPSADSSSTATKRRSKKTDYDPLNGDI
jgi:hypothetical protein